MTGTCRMLPKSLSNRQREPGYRVVCFCTDAEVK